MHDIRKKLEQLRKYWFDDNMSLKFVDATENRLRNLVFKEKLAESKAVMDIVEETQQRIRAVDILLTTDEEMSEMERKLLFREKKVYGFFLDRLDARKLDEQFERVGKLLDDELRNVGLLQDGAGE